MSTVLTPRRIVVFGAIGAAAVLLSVFGSSSDEPSAATVRPPSERSVESRGANSTLSANAAALLTRLAHRSTDDKTAPALFASRSWYVPPPPVAAPPAEPPAPPPPPTAPPLPFTFIGSYSVQGDQAVFFVARNDRIYDLKTGDAVDNDYTLVAVDASNMIFNYKPLNARQTLALGGVK
jgi:hypothetical protein